MNAIVVGNGVAEGAGASGIDAWSHLEQVSVPTTVACGDLDMPHLRDHAEQLIDRVPLMLVVPIYRAALTCPTSSARTSSPTSSPQRSDDCPTS